MSSQLETCRLKTKKLEEINDINMINNNIIKVDQKMMKMS